MRLSAIGSFASSCGFVAIALVSAGCPSANNGAGADAAPSASAVVDAAPAPPASAAAATTPTAAMTAHPHMGDGGVHGKWIAPKCAAGTQLAWADNVSAKCLKPCTDDKECAATEACQPGNLVDADGNPIPHNIITVCTAKAGTTPTPAPTASGAAGGTLPAPAAGTMEISNPKGLACPAGYSNQGGLVKSCNVSCKKNTDCKAPFTCESLGGDPPHNCFNMKALQN